MKTATLNDISFDKDDSLLFAYSDDLLLKAKAIQNSILPKLQVLLQESVSLIRKIYEIEIYDEDSTLSKYPSFRENRENELKANYENAFVGICGNRLPIWKSIKRTDKKPVKILPIRYGFELNPNGLDILFRFDTDIDLSTSSYKKLFSTFSKDIELISAVCNHFGFQIKLPNDNKNIFVPIKKQIKNYQYVYFQIIKHYHLPLEHTNLSEMPLCFAALFPLYDAMLRYAKGEFGRFKELISRLQDYVLLLPVKKNSENESIIDSTAIMESANKKIDSIGIRASIRWQVFERDDFRCVACGASALDGAILHVDHILPRSKGGADSIENYQTLCQTCNIGKSNKSERNLRERG